MTGSVATLNIDDSRHNYNQHSRLNCDTITLTWTFRTIMVSVTFSNCQSWMLFLLSGVMIGVVMLIVVAPFKICDLTLPILVLTVLCSVEKIWGDEMVVLWLLVQQH
jgi:hypothetical protein